MSGDRTGVFVTSIRKHTPGVAMNTGPFDASMAELDGSGAPKPSINSVELLQHTR